MDEIRKQYEQAVAVKDMMSTQGWEVLQNHLDEIYAVHVAKLIEKEDLDSRIILRGIGQVRNAVEYIIAHGQKAYEEMRKGE